MAHWLTGIAVLLAVVVIFSDIHARLVPNRALLSAMCLGLVVLLYASINGNSIAGDAFLGLLIGLLALLPFHLLGWMGAGDVKFFAVLGFLLGPQSLLPIWLLSMCLLTVHGIALLVWKHSANWRYSVLACSASAAQATALMQFGRKWQQQQARARGTRKGMPYAAHLGLCALGWISWSHLQ